MALVSHEYPPYHIGGVGSYCEDLARFLAREQIMVTVFCGRSTRIHAEKLNDYLEIVRLPFPDMALRAYWFQLRNLSFLRKALQNFDVVHAISPQAAAVSSFAGNRNVPLVTTLHAVPRFALKAFFNAPRVSWTLRELASNFIETPINEIFTRNCLKNSYKTVLVSRNLMTQAKVAFGEISEEKAVVIPNGVDFQRIEKIKRTKDQAERTDVLFYGRLVWTKGVTYLIDALTQLKQDFPGIRAKLIGTGPLLERLKRVVADRDLIHNVQFSGYLSREEVLREIFRSSVIALPSIYEAGSVAVLEAMACERPVVAFDYLFTREFVKDLRSGLLAKPKDSTDLAMKIRLLLQDKKWRADLGRNGCRLAYRAYNWDMIAEKYARIYRELE